MNNTTKTAAFAAGLLLLTGSHCFAQDRDATLKEAGKAFAAGIPDVAVPRAVRESLKAFDARIKKMERRLAGLVPVPNLTIDTRGRNLGCRLITRKDVDLDTSYKLGSAEPLVRLALRAGAAGPKFEAETSPLSRSASFSGSWTLSRWTLRGGMSRGAGRSSHQVGLSYKLSERQTLELSESGKDRRLSWGYTLKFKS